MSFDNGMLNLYFSSIFLAGLSLALGVQPVQSQGRQDQGNTGILIEHAEVVIPQGDTWAMAGYLVIWNGTTRQADLRAVKSNSFGSIAVYKTIFTDGVARMRPVEGTLPIPANSELVMKRGGIHLVLSAPEHQLIAGETVEMTLIFEDGVQIVASAKVLHLNEKLTDHHHSDVDGVSRE